MKVYYQAPINEQFEDSYNQSGLQPSTGGVMPIRKVKVEYKNDPTKRRGGKQDVKKVVSTARKTTGYGMQAAGVGMQATGKATKMAGRAATSAGVALSSTGVGAVAGVPLAVAGGATQAVGMGVDAAGKVTRRAGKVVTGKKVAKKAARAAIKTAQATNPAGLIKLMWPLMLWLFVQLPFAVFTLFFLAISQIIYKLFALDPSEDERTTALGEVLNIGAWVARKLLDLIGFDLTTLNPTSFMMIGLYVTLTVGIITILIKSIAMTLQGEKVFFGKNTGLKFLTLCLALVGYSFPFFNLFPWYMAWEWVIHKSSR